MNLYCIKERHKVFINTDPQRRCYYGCFYSYEIHWSEWTIIDSNLSEETAIRRMKFWKELNDYAVSQRGEEAKREFLYIIQ